jgi:hypothetical protein
MTGLELKQKLEENGYKQTYLATLLGYSYHYVCGMLNSDKELSPFVKLTVKNKWGWE